MYPSWMPAASAWAWVNERSKEWSSGITGAGGLFAAGGMVGGGQRRRRGQRPVCKATSVRMAAWSLSSRPGGLVQACLSAGRRQVTAAALCGRRAGRNKRVGERLWGCCPRTSRKRLMFQASGTPCPSSMPTARRNAGLPPSSQGNWLAVVSLRAAGLSLHETACLIIANNPRVKGAGRVKNKKIFPGPPLAERNGRRLRGTLSSPAHFRPAIQAYPQQRKGLAGSRPLPSGGDPSILLGTRRRHGPLLRARCRRCTRYRNLASCPFTNTFAGRANTPSRSFAVPRRSRAECGALSVGVRRSSGYPACSLLAGTQ